MYVCIYIYVEERRKVNLGLVNLHFHSLDISAVLSLNVSITYCGIGIHSFLLTFLHNNPREKRVRKKVEVSG